MYRKRKVIYKNHYNLTPGGDFNPMLVPEIVEKIYGENNYRECPACGSPYYDGYCEECGYPDINQGWLGENYYKL